MKWQPVETTPRDGNCVGQPQPTRNWADDLIYYGLMAVLWCMLTISLLALTGNHIVERLGLSLP